VKVLLVYAHPLEESLAAAARDRAVANLREAGHEVDLLDLHAEGFDAVLTAEEAASWDDQAQMGDVLASHAARLRAVDALVFVYPTWWSGPPAILKGWIDRVFRPGVAFSLKPGSNRVRGLLRNVRHIVVLTTHGSSKWVNSLEGEAGKRIFTRSLRLVCHPLCRVRWVGLYDVDRSRPEDRDRWLDRVEEAMGRLSESMR
jgi:NAD(P)H dehydrogenase (quinone)